MGRETVARAFIASLSGTALEWYDFAIYSAASALVFGHLFFPSHDPLAATMLAFSTYAVGYVARPLGGIFFGRLGDVIGRKKVLVSTLVLIGVATFLIGLLPTHASIGGTAAVLLVTLRFAQGVGVGALGAGVWPFVFFPAIADASFLAFTGGIVVGLVPHSTMYGPLAAYVAFTVAVTLVGLLLGRNPAPHEDEELLASGVHA